MHRWTPSVWFATQELRRVFLLDTNLRCHTSALLGRRRYIKAATLIFITAVIYIITQEAAGEQDCADKPETLASVCVCVCERSTHLAVKVLLVLEEVCVGELLALLTSSADWSRPLFLSAGGVASSSTSTSCLRVTRFRKHLAPG